MTNMQNDPTGSRRAEHENTSSVSDGADGDGLVFANTDMPHGREARHDWFERRRHSDAGRILKRREYRHAVMQARRSQKFMSGLAYPKPAATTTIVYQHSPRQQTYLDMLCCNAVAVLVQRMRWDMADANRACHDPRAPLGLRGDAARALESTGWDAAAIAAALRLHLPDEGATA
jgi:hypothetical protein